MMMKLGKRVPTQRDATTSEPPKQRRLINIISLFLVVVALLVAGFRFSNDARLLLLVAQGRSPVCSIIDVIKGGLEGSEQEATVKVLAEGSRIVEERPDGLMLWDTPDGKFWIPAGTADSLLFVLAEQRREIYGSGQNGVRRGDIVLDCGAHVGVFTRVALALGAEKVVAIEPAPATVVALKLNHAEDIAAGRLIICEKGVWDSETKMPFRLDPHESMVNKVAPGRAEGDNVIEISLTTIDKLVEDLNLDRVDFIKMDIEGAEQRALAGAQDTLRTYKPRLAISAYHLEDDQIKIPEIVAATRPDYEMECGPCGFDRGWIVPSTLLFH